MIEEEKIILTPKHHTHMYLQSCVLKTLSALKIECHLALTSLFSNGGLHAGY